MTGSVIHLTIADMAKPGRCVGTPSEFRDAVMERTRAGRDKLGWSLDQMAQRLSEKVGRPISADTYRKWESEAMIPHDVILAFCDLIAMHPYEFLSPAPFVEPARLSVRRTLTAS